MTASLKGDCILFEKSLTPAGYGQAYINGKMMRAHRVVMGNPQGKVVMHLCDNRACVNPDHLQVGTTAENVQDMVNKGRQSKGSGRPASKLTEEDIPIIRAYQGQLSSRKVAAYFGISQSLVSLIWTKKAWRHVDGN